MAAVFISEKPINWDMICAIIYSLRVPYTPTGHALIMYKWWFSLSTITFLLAPSVFTVSWPVKSLRLIECHNQCVWIRNCSGNSWDCHSYKVKAHSEKHFSLYNICYEWGTHGHSASVFMLYCVIFYIIIMHWREEWHHWCSFDGAIELDGLIFVVDKVYY